MGGVLGRPGLRLRGPVDSTALPTFGRLTRISPKVTLRPSVVFQGDPVIRRPIVLVIATLAVVLGACQSSPQASPVSDPKVILTNTVMSLKDVKTLEFSGTFTGAAKVQGLDLDLSTVKLSGQADLPNQKAKATLDAPSLLGTKIDSILIDTTAYYKVAGPAALLLHASADKWTTVAVPSAGSIFDVAKDPTSAVQQLEAQLEKLPSPPVKGADDKCGDQDCYHVTIQVPAAQVKANDPTGMINGDVTLDVWSRKSDFRPARLGITAATVDMGTIGASIDIQYDVSVSIEAPPADQVEAGGGPALPSP